MRDIMEAIEAGEARKAAVFGHTDDETPRMQVTDSFAESAMFSGFDIDTDELRDISLAASSQYVSLSVTSGLLRLFQASFIDGILIGLLLAQQEVE